MRLSSSLDEILMEVIHMQLGRNPVINDFKCAQKWDRWMDGQAESNRALATFFGGPYLQTLEHKNVNIFLSISFNICFGCSKEPSH